jgi:hypothetical protein
MNDEKDEKETKQGKEKEKEETTRRHNEEFLYTCGDCRAINWTENLQLLSLNYKEYLPYFCQPIQNDTVRHAYTFLQQRGKPEGKPVGKPVGKRKGFYHADEEDETDVHRGYGSDPREWLDEQAENNDDDDGDVRINNPSPSSYCDVRTEPSSYYNPEQPHYTPPLVETSNFLDDVAMRMNRYRYAETEDREKDKKTRFT